MSTSSAGADAAGPVRASRMARRQFVLILSTLAVAGAMGCGEDERAELSPIAHFMALSSLLTGFGDLDQRHGEIYLRALRENPGSASALDDLLAKAGYGGNAPPRALADLARRGIFRDERLRALSDTITLWWYTGVYEGRDGPAVATYTESLGWRSLPYTNAPSTCGPGMGFWAEPPAS